MSEHFDFIRDLERQSAEQDALLHRAAEMLRKLEWFPKTPTSASTCPSCGNYYHERHSPNCALAALIRELESRLAL